MIPGGYGFEVLKFERDCLRDIARLPEDVRIVAALPSIPLNGERWGPELPPGWVHDVPLRPVFILICHRYCPRVDRGCPYQVDSLDGFLKRYEVLNLEERMSVMPTPGPDNQGSRIAWHRDEDGEVREYVWHDKAGWVPLWTKT